MFINDKSTQVEEYTSPSVYTLFIKNECIICGSRTTGEKVDDSSDWGGEDNWE